MSALTRIAALCDAEPHDRSKHLGGSEMAALMGVSPWSTPVQLWLEKTGRKPKPKIDPAKERIFARGKRLEPVILDMVIDKLDEQGHDVQLIATNKRYFDPEFPWLSVEIDFELMLDGEHVNGDCKSVIGFARSKWGEYEDTEDVPMEYAAQFMTGLSVTGRRRCLVAALIGLDDIRIYWTVRDDETIAAMRALAERFWTECVLGDRIPDPIVFEDIKALFPVDNGRSIEATDEIVSLVDELRAAKRAAKQSKERVEFLQFHIANFVSPHSTLTLKGKPLLTWRAEMRRQFLNDVFKEQHPLLHEQFTVENTIRVMRIKKP